MATQLTYYVFQFGVLWVFFFLHESCVYSELFIGLLFDWITLSHDTDGTGRTPHTRYDELIQATVIIILSCHGPHASLFVIAMMERLEKKKCKKLFVTSCVIFVMKSVSLRDRQY